MRNNFNLHNYMNMLKTSMHFLKKIKWLIRPKTIELEGIKINIGDYLSSSIKEAMYGGYYEQQEIQLVKSYLASDDVIMEIGAGIGFLSSYCAKKIGSERIFAYEANIALEEPIRNTYAINHVNPNLEMCLIGEQIGIQNFYITKDFWGSSFIKPNPETIEKTLTIPVKSFREELKRINPSFVIIDIEGGEYDLLKDNDLYNVQKIVIELHNTIIGYEKVEDVKSKFKSWGFKIVENLPNGQDEIVFMQR